MLNTKNNRLHLKHMKSHLVHILILTLFLFQNVWAMEQTYLVFCETVENAQELEQHAHDEDTPTEHDHGFCTDCCHLSTSFVGITENLIVDTTQFNQQYNLFVKIKHLSIYNKPIIPPPIV